MQATYRLYPLIAVALLAAASIWLERLSRGPDATPERSSNTVPDFIAEQTRIVGFGKDGDQRYALESDRMTHFPGADITHVERPRLELVSGESLLSVNADHGEVSSGGERVDFTGNVDAQRTGRPGQSGITFASERLTVWPDEHRAETTVPVRLTQGPTTALANSLRADNLFGTLDLIGKARVTIPRRQGNTP